MTRLAAVATIAPQPAAPKADRQSSGEQQSPCEQSSFEQMVQRIAAAPQEDAPPVRGRIARTNIDRVPGKLSKPADESPAPVVDAPVPASPAPLKLKPLEDSPNDQQAALAVAKNAPPEAAPEEALRTDVALQVRIRLPQELPPPAPARTPIATSTPNPRPSRDREGAVTDTAADGTDPGASPVPEISKIAVAAIKAAAAAHPRSSETPSGPEAAPITVAHAANPPFTTAAPPEASAHPASSQTPSPASPNNPVQIPEPVPGPAAAHQPLRSISLEFAPDGAGDVRLRLSERAGEVHISLHSSDPAVTGRLHEGVHDLVGSLANAGYDADAWTPSQGRQQNQRQSDVPRKMRRDGSSGGEDFTLQQPIQEIS